jgi:hypothetical protein
VTQCSDLDHAKRYENPKDGKALGRPAEAVTESPPEAVITPRGKLADSLGRNGKRSALCGI